MPDSIAKASIFSLVANWVALPLGIITNIIFARIVGPQVKGLYTVLAATQGLLLLPGTAIQASLTHHVAHHHPNIARLRYHINIIVIVQAFASIIILSLLMLIPKTRILILGGLPPIMLIALLGQIIVNLWYLYHSALLPGLQMYSKLVLINGIGLFVVNGVMLTFLGMCWISKQSPHLSWVILQNLIAISIVSIILRLFLARIRQAPEQNSNSPIPLRAIFGFATPVLMRNLVEWANYRMDVYFVVVFAGPVQLGLYTVAIGLAQQLWTVPFAIGGPLFAKISHEGDTTASRSIVQFAFRLMAIVSFSLSLIIGIGAPVLLASLYGQRFAGSLPLLLILLPGVATIGPTRVISSFMNGTGRPKEPLHAELVGLCATLTLDLLLIPRHGAIGAAIASSVAYTAYSVFVSYRYVTICNIRWSELLVPRLQDWTNTKRILVEFSETFKRRGLVKLRSDK